MPLVEQCRSNCRDWRGVLPQTTNNAAATANQIRARPSNPASCRTGIYAPVDTSGEMATPLMVTPLIPIATGTRMFCTQCGRATEKDAKFCGNCGTPVRFWSSVSEIEQSASVTPAVPQTGVPVIHVVDDPEITLSAIAAPPVPQIKEASIAEAQTFERFPKRMAMSLSVYLGLCFGAWVCGAVVTSTISLLLGGAYAKATVPTIIGMWIGKLLQKNTRRHWGGIVAFPIVTLCAALLGTALAGPLNGSVFAMICLASATALSNGLFSLLNGK